MVHEVGYPKEFDMKDSTVIFTTVLVSNDNTELISKTFYFYNS